MNAGQLFHRGILLGAIVIVAGFSGCGGSNSQSTSVQPQSVTGSRAAQSVAQSTGAALQYPRNDNAASLASFKSSVQISQAILSAPSERMMQLAQANLVRFSQTNQAARGMNLYSVDPNRMVYEITATFSSHYTYFGTVWSSGSKVYVVDAASGDVLYATVSGTQTGGPQVAKCAQSVCFSAN